METTPNPQTSQTAQPTQQTKKPRKIAPAFTQPSIQIKGIDFVPTSPQKTITGYENWKFPGLGEDFTVQTLETLLSSPSYLVEFLRSKLNSMILQKYQAVDGDLNLFKDAIENLFSEETKRSPGERDYNWYIGQAQKHSKYAKFLQKHLLVGFYTDEEGNEINVKEELEITNKQMKECLAKAMELSVTM